MSMSNEEYELGYYYDQNKIQDLNKNYENQSKELKNIKSNIRKANTRFCIATSFFAIIILCLTASVVFIYYLTFVEPKKKVTIQNNLNLSEQINYLQNRLRTPPYEFSSNYPI